MSTMHAIGKSEKSSQLKGKDVKDDAWIHTVCEACYSPCGALVHRVNGVVVKIEGDTDCPHNRGKLCAKGYASIMTHYDPNRVKTPLKRTNPNKGIGVDPKWKEISWEEAIDTIVQKLKGVRGDHPGKLIFASWDLRFLTIALGRAWMFAFGHLTHLATAYRCGAGLHGTTYLTNGTFHNEIDFDYCNYYLTFGNQMGGLVGINPMLNAQKVAEAKSRGMKTVVVDPICTPIAAKADEWVPIRPGTDGAMALAMLHVIINEQGTFDSEFLKKHTNAPYLVLSNGYYIRDKQTNKPLVWDVIEKKAKPFDKEVKDYALDGNYNIDGAKCQPAFQMLREHVKQWTPETASEITTVPAATIRRIAQEFVKAARIGSKIVIKGKELPYRPAAANYYRGITASKHATNSALAIYLLNFMVGGMFVPGGHTGVNVVGPSLSWFPGADPDGLIVPPSRLYPTEHPSDKPMAPNPDPQAPTGLTLGEFLPGSDAGASLGITVLNPEKFKTPIKPEVMINSRTNVMLSRENVQSTAEFLKRIPFIVSFANLLDETAEFADIVLPDTSALERLALFPSQPFLQHSTVSDSFYWGIIQPVVPPVGQARNWHEVMIELADRLGFLKDFNNILNVELGEPYKLDPDKKYSLEEIYDRLARTEFGDDHGLEWFKENGCIAVERSADERYPRNVLKARLPIYYENYLKLGQKVTLLAKDMDVKWDTSDFLALPTWKPGPAHENISSGYNLYCVNYKTAIHQMTFTVENPWLNELTERSPYLYKIMINTETAKARNIKDGDTIRLESPAGKVQGVAKVTECVHPEVLGIAGTFGAWATGKPIAKGKGVHHNSLIPYDVDRLEGITCAVDDLVEVKLSKIGGLNG